MLETGATSLITVQGVWFREFVMSMILDGDIVADTVEP